MRPFFVAAPTKAIHRSLKSEQAGPTTINGSFVGNSVEKDGAPSFVALIGQN
jgi:hypothetical protein